jgi:magnesium chelatase family protein
MARRLDGTPWTLNSEIPGAELRRSYPPAPGALQPLDRALERGQITLLGAVGTIRVAWSIADVAGRDRPSRDDCQLALALRMGTAP